MTTPLMPAASIAVNVAARIMSHSAAWNTGVRGRSNTGASSSVTRGWPGRQSTTTRGMWTWASRTSTRSGLPDRCDQQRVEPAAIDHDELAADSDTGVGAEEHERVRDLLDAAH